jgi:hypothetical protein
MMAAAVRPESRAKDADEPREPDEEDEEDDDPTLRL